MLSIDPRNRIPIFEQIKNQITELVFLGVLKPHDQLPSIRAMAHDLKLNVNTIKKAFQDLESVGVVYTLTGRGSFIADSPQGNERMKAQCLEEIRHVIKIGRTNGISKARLLELIEDIYKV